MLRRGRRPQAGDPRAAGHPVGLRAHLRRRLRRERRGWPARSCTVRGPTVGALAPDRPRRRLAGEGRAQRSAARAEGVPVPRRARRHAGSAAARAVCGSSARSRSTTGRAASTWSRAMVRSALPELGESTGRAAAPADPAHLGLAGAERERLAGRTPRLRVVLQRRRARRTPRTGRTRSRAPTTCRPTSRPRCSGRR